MRKLLGVILCCSVVGCGGGDEEGPLATFRVEGHGMSPTLEDSHRVAVLDYEGATPRRGDVVVFASPVGGVHREFIKRIIGLPGDTIEIDGLNSRVLINGTPLSESYANGQTGCFDSCSWTVPGSGSDVSVRKESFSPREGATPGVADETCPVNGCYFVLGDNRQNSSDSRQGWLVPAENIRGYVEVD